MDYGKILKESLCFKCVYYENEFRVGNSKICVVCSLKDPYMPRLKRKQCKDFCKE